MPCKTFETYHLSPVVAAKVIVYMLFDALGFRRSIGAVCIKAAFLFKIDGILKEVVMQK